jgi:purine nucleosidase
MHRHDNGRMMKKIILDTDPGTDVDDAVALALCLQSPEIDLAGVTIVAGDVDTRGQIALRMLEAAGRTDIPVALGAREPLIGESRFAWGGWEGKGILERFDDALSADVRPAWKFLAERTAESPGELTVVPIGPLTNIALAIRAFPAFRKNVKEIVLMGGNGRFGPEAWKTPVREYNVGSDAEAARIVFESGIPITMVTLDVTLQVTIERAMVSKLRGTGNPLSKTVADQLEIYLDAHGRQKTFMHDPLAVALLVDPALCRRERMLVRVETRGEFTSGMTVCTEVPEKDSNAGVCVSVDAERFEGFLCGRLLGEQNARLNPGAKS